jgi:nicotinamide riboside transporter PnuC
MEAIMPIMIGVALSATCGFRVFVPLLAVNIGTRALDADGQPRIELAGGFDWLSSDIALMVFLVATLFEIGGYYIPWIDNLLDTIASPASIVAGTVITASFVTGMDPWLQWLLGVIAGGGAAGAVQATTVVTRASSTVTTGGLGNPIVASVETSGAFLGSALSIVAVEFAIVVFVLLLGSGVWIWWRRRRHKLAEAH